MGTQRLGTKKLALIESIIGKPVTEALVGGGREHYQAEAHLANGAVVWVNYKTRCIISNEQEDRVKEETTKTEYLFQDILKKYGKLA